MRAGGEPVRGALVVLERPGGGEPDFAERTPSDSGWLDIPRGRIRRGQEMLVVAAGCGILRGRLPAGYKVELPPALPVTLRLLGDFELPRAPASLSFRVQPVGVVAGLGFALECAVAPADYWQRDEMDREPYPRFEVDRDTRAVDILVPYPGRWQLRWSVMVTERRGGGITQGGHGPSEAIPITVPAGGGRVPFSIDPEEIARQGPR